MRPLYTATTLPEYTIVKRTTGYPHLPRTGWNIAAVDVQDAAPTNTQSLSVQAELQAQLHQQTSALHTTKKTAISLRIQPKKRKTQSAQPNAKNDKKPKQQ